MSSAKAFDRKKQDVGNIVLFEHLNLKVPDFDTAIRFYVEGLCLTRDPYYMVGPVNMWINNGYQQLHFQKGEAQRFRGEVVLVIPDLQHVADNLKKVEPYLSRSRFSWAEESHCIVAACPWGNRYRIRQFWEGFDQPRGIPHLQADVPRNTGPSIARFYRSVLDARVESAAENAAEVMVTVGPGQTISFKETNKDVPEFDGHHFCIYLANLSPSYERLFERDRVTSEDNVFQYRFQEIFDPDTAQTVYEIEHEVRSLFHPMFMRPLVNRWKEKPLP
jgi:catechol 2,3-dioxygenase-like lactoylglutathione lyase family enzyme